MPFVMNKKFIYEEYQKKHQEKFWILQSMSGLGKKQCTVQMLTRTEGEQPSITVIFLDEGKKYQGRQKCFLPF